MFNEDFFILKAKSGCWILIGMLNAYEDSVATYSLSARRWSEGQGPHEQASCICFQMKGRPRVMGR